MELGPESDTPPGVGCTARAVSAGGDARNPHRGQNARHEERPQTDGERYMHGKADELRHPFRGGGSPRARRNTVETSVSMI